ncbi:hypothetical protein Mterra_03924 [Calidithermus terrae]|uniref:Uncharacterized protein n=1 Tax=Calidithermus terrae TaxID=1408545 RepID=A0A399E177_9DEIN|nr:hypothetical protein Mterra_03924 [Calidithermus terrae]
MDSTTRRKRSSASLRSVTSISTPTTRSACPCASWMTMARLLTQRTCPPGRATRYSNSRGRGQPSRRLASTMELMRGRSSGWTRSRKASTPPRKVPGSRPSSRSKPAVQWWVSLTTSHCHQPTPSGSSSGVGRRLGLGCSGFTSPIIHPSSRLFMGWIRGRFLFGVFLCGWGGGVLRCFGLAVSVPPSGAGGGGHSTWRGHRGTRPGVRRKPAPPGGPRGTPGYRQSRYGLRPPPRRHAAGPQRPRTRGCGPHLDSAACPSAPPRPPPPA